MQRSVFLFCVCFFKMISFYYLKSFMYGGLQRYYERDRLKALN